MNMKYYIIALAVVLVSCMQDRYADQIKSLEGLNNVLTESEQKLAAIDTSRLLLVRETVDFNLNYIETHYNDTIDKEFAIFLSNYNTIRKGYKRFNQKYTNLKKELEYSRKQIIDLKADLEANLIDEKKVEDYYHTEEMAVNTFEASLKKFLEGLEFSFERFDELNPEVEKIVNDLKAVADSTANADENS